MKKLVPVIIKKGEALIHTHNWEEAQLKTKPWLKDSKLL